MGRFDRREVVPLAVVLGFGLGLRVALSLGATGIYWPDTSLFVGSARSILADAPFRYNVFKTPLYSVFLAPFIALGGETPATGEAIVFVHHAMGLAATGVFYLVARRVFGRTVAFWSSLLFTAHTLLLFYELSALSEILFILLLAVLLHQGLMTLSNPTPGRAALVGLLNALATLTRPVAHGFVALLVVGVILAGCRARLRQALAAALVLALTYGAAMLPWLYINHRTYGYWGISLGQGLGLFSRVFMTDQADPVPDSRYPDVKEALEQTRDGGEPNPYRVIRLLRARRYSAVEMDRRMFGLAFETVRAHPWAYAVNSLRAWGRQLMVVGEDIHVCRGDTGPYPCFVKMKSSPMFPSVPAEGRRGLKEAIGWWFDVGYTRMNVLVPLAFLGFALSLFSDGIDRKSVALLAAAVVFFSGVPALVQFPEERYRLPIDALLFMFAVFSVQAVASRIRRLAPPGRGGTAAAGEGYNR